jgi:peptidylprolyl isomerase
LLVPVPLPPWPSSRRRVVVAATALLPLALGACALRRGGERLPAAIPPVAGAMRTQYVMRYVEVAPGTGAPAEPGQVYAVHYTGWLRDGTRFDSSRDRGEPIRFEQGKRRVIPGWDAGFEGMRVGGRRRFFIPYQLAYGVKGRPPRIPPRAELIFDVELVGVEAPPADTAAARRP